MSQKDVKIIVFKEQKKAVKKHVKSYNPLNGIFINEPIYKPSNFLNQTCYEEVINTSGISIITCTKRQKFMSNLFDNYTRQEHTNKELLIVLHDDDMNLEKWKNHASRYENVRIIQLSPRITLGECLNIAVYHSKYNIITKFDDDDYYGQKYLTEAIKALVNTRVKVLGKGATYVYFKALNTIAIRTPDQENRYVSFVNGSTLTFKKEVFEKIKFPHVSVGEDVGFCLNCMKNNIPILSTSIKNHVLIRHPSKKQHTWKINDHAFLRRYCVKISETDDYISYAGS